MNINVGALFGRTTCGRMPLHLACLGGHTECAKIIAFNNPDVVPELLYIHDFNGQTPLHSACFYGKSVELVKLCVIHGADISVTGCVFWGDGVTESLVDLTALATAVVAGSKDVVKYLLTLEGIDYVTPAEVDSEYTEWRELHGLTPFELAEFFDFDEIRDLIKERLSPPPPEQIAKPRQERRSTPVKERFEKIGLPLPATPSGIREGKLSSSPRVKRKAANDLHKHQVACRRKVERAELALEKDKPEYKRRLSKNREDKRNSCAKSRRLEEADEDTSGDPEEGSYYGIGDWILECGEPPPWFDRPFII